MNFQNLHKMYMLLEMVLLDLCNHFIGKAIPQSIKRKAFSPVIGPEIYYDSLSPTYSPYGVFLTRFHDFYSIFWLLEQFHSSIWNSVLFILNPSSQAWFSLLLPQHRLDLRFQHLQLRIGESHSPCHLLNSSHWKVEQGWEEWKKLKALGLLIEWIRLWLFGPAILVANVDWPWDTLFGASIHILVLSWHIWVLQRGCGALTAQLPPFISTLTSPTSTLPTVYPAASFCWITCPLHRFYMLGQAQTATVSVVCLFLIESVKLGIVCNLVS